jgi:hypothetical protein
MTRRRWRINNHINKDKIIEMRNHIANKTKRSIVFLVSSLIAPCTILIFKIGESFYPPWIIAHRTQIIGILLLSIVVITNISPLIVEVNSNPRPLSGPGDRPSGYF